MHRDLTLQPKLFVSHDALLAASLGDKAIVLDRGHARAAGSIERGRSAYSELTMITMPMVPPADPARG